MLPRCCSLVGRSLATVPRVVSAMMFREASRPGKVNSWCSTSRNAGRTNCERGLSAMSRSGTQGLNICHVERVDARYTGKVSPTCACEYALSWNLSGGWWKVLIRRSRRGVMAYQPCSADSARVVGCHWRRLIARSTVQAPHYHPVFGCHPK